MPTGAHAATANRHGSLPIAFEPNQGQSPSDSKFLVRRGNSTLFFRETETVLAVAAPTSAPVKSVETLHFTWVGSRPVTISGEAKSSGVSNYLIGRDSSKWTRNVPNFGRIRYRNLYPGVDLVYYGKDGQLEYDLVVAPGADLSAVRLHIEGGKGLDLAGGDLVVHTAHGDVVQKAPVVYQEIAGRRTTVESRYRLTSDGNVAFDLGQYDSTRPLVIDPVITYGTLYGGSGIDGAESIAVDSTGAVYVAGTTNSGNLVIPGAGVRSGSNLTATDAFVMKLSPSGSLVFASYLGGALPDQAHGIAVDSNGSPIIVGETLSGDYPVFSPMRTGINGGGDAFITKLSPSGSSFVYSSYIGGSSADIAWAVAVDTSDNAYVVGQTASLLLHDNPVANTRSGTTDAFLAKVLTTKSFGYVRFIGGPGAEAAYAVAVKGNYAYITGTTTVVGTPLTSTGFQTTHGGGTDAFIQKADISTGAQSVWAYYGGPANETPRGIALDGLGNLYIAGSVNGSGLPTRNPLQASFLGTPTTTSDGFVMCTDLNISTLVAATYIGGTGDDQILGLSVNPNNSVFVAGFTGSSDFPTTNNIRTGTLGLSTDVFVTKFSYRLSSYLFSTYLGGANTDKAYAIVSDNTGAYLTGSTLSGDFQGVTGTLSNQDSFVMKITSNCNYSFSPNPVVLPSAGGQVTVNVTAGTECGWTATTSDSFLTIGTPSYGGGNGSFTISATANTGAPARSGSVTVSGVTIPVTQASGCTYGINSSGTSVPASSVTTGSVNLTVTLSSCTWNATSSAPWVTITSAAGGSNNATVGWRAAINPLPAQRTATLTVGGMDYVITQAARVRSGDAVATSSNGAWRQDAARAFIQNSSNRVFAWGTAGWTAVAGDWNGDGTTKVGVFQNGVWILDMNNNRMLDSADRIFQWGNAGMTPVVGDWNGDGTTKVGVYQNGSWYVDINGNRQLDNGEAFAWGPSNGVPVVGDWNGDGRSKVGAYNSTNGTWILDTNGDYAYQFPSDFFFQWGAAGFTPLVGDFFGLGRDTVAAYQLGRFWLENGDGFSNAGDVNFTLISNSTGTPFVGDWNSNGKAKAGIRTGNQLTLDYDGDGVLNLATDKQFTFGAIGEQIVIGRWN